jgi:hypothetical protein
MIVPPNPERIQDRLKSLLSIFVGCSPIRKGHSRLLRKYQTVFRLHIVDRYPVIYADLGKHGGERNAGRLAKLMKGIIQVKAEPGLGKQDSAKLLKLGSPAPEVHLANCILNMLYLIVG